jgi:hypothetical protein
VLVMFIVITFVDLVTMALFANVTGDSRQWMAARLAALPRISVDLLTITLIHGTDIRQNHFIPAVTT